MPKLRVRFSIRGFYALKANVSDAKNVCYSYCRKQGKLQEERDRWEEGATHLRGLLSSPRLALGERRRSGFLALLGRLSLRKEDHQRIMFTK